MPDTPTKELNDLIDYLIINNQDLYKNIMRFFDDYGLNISDSQYRNIHDFLSNVEKWKLDRPMSETKSYYDEGLYTITQYVTNAIEMFSKVYPNALMNNDGFYKNIPKHWDLSKEHIQDVEVFVNKYYENLVQLVQTNIDAVYRNIKKDFKRFCLKFKDNNLVKLVDEKKDYTSLEISFYLNK
jgi:uncharacterized protein YbgA (DUF1722 family)